MDPSPAAPGPASPRVPGAAEPPAGGPWARFDDLRTGSALLCPPPDRVLTTTRSDEVADVLRELHDATEAGAWAFGYVSYEAASGLDAGLPGGHRAGEPPLIWFGLCAEPAPVPPVGPPAGPPVPAAAWRPDWSDDQHARAVTTVREHIAAGETYQCNLTDRLRCPDAGDPEELYARLALAQRGAHNAYLDLGRFAVASASPELFFEWVGSRVRTRPMKGTAARGRTTAEDREQSRRLRASSKEQAENLMIVDLLRNDLGRIAEVGSVTVDELFALERYPTVWQMTSQVSARLRPGTGLAEIFRALFPCGSVTGAPKQRTMQLIDELEPTPRGLYCGAIGLVAPPTAPFRARFSVAIRTAVVDRSTGAGVYGAGGGITWGSDPARERAELHAKAAVLGHPATDHQLLETLAFVPGEGLRNLDRHLTRMADSADWSGFRFERDAVLGSLRSAVAGLGEPARVRALLFRDGRVEVGTGPLPEPLDRPVRLAVDDEPVDATSPWLQHKTTRRDVYRSRALRHPEADDVVLVNQRGELTETTIASLAVRLGGRWWTPPTDVGCLPGVERGRLLELGRLHERVLTVADLRAAEELAVVSSLRGWRSARLLPAGPGADADRPLARPPDAGAPVRHRSSAGTGGSAPSPTP
ncbi:aminodeoxychorismate synthase component I [Blastococcus saxobsidens]|uniref:Para-aminobenzoate synthetase/4-amino-4-deoxychorismate lyase n=1 Tax=Blastococcus saxobsidens TaxID=138336 RepID=A0A4Q7Y5C3_9ACTN|nr:aminodeoxychorismate synthase component I [Blastococcus saxobsidens]RZU31079.1 para-aminobenzoate synthetase/4-amino-4-deoxychorismate lyase [Blastococcus saxobsidens]